MFFRKALLSVTLVSDNLAAPKIARAFFDSTEMLTETPVHMLRSNASLPKEELSSASTNDWLHDIDGEKNIGNERTWQYKNWEGVLFWWRKVS